MHDASKVLLGQNLSSAKEISCFNSDPATFLAGLAVSLGSDSGLSLLKSAGMRVGVSLGKSLSDSKKTSVLRSGESVPIRAHLKRSTGTVTITNIANLVDGTDDTITIGGTAFTATDGAVTPGQATFDARTGTTEAAASLAAQINAHATVKLKVYAVAAAAIVTLYAVVEGAGTGHDVTTTYEQLGTGVGATVEQAALAGGSNTISDIAYIAIGGKAYINDITGKLDIAMSGHSTISDATYISIEKNGIDESGNTVAAALVDMPGGL
jgi:hypothetical protein